MSDSINKRLITRRDMLRGTAVERLYRDVRALRIYEGTTEIHRSIIARVLLGGEKARQEAHKASKVSQQSEAPDDRATLSLSAQLPPPSKGAGMTERPSSPKNPREKADADLRATLPGTPSKKAPVRRSTMPDTPAAKLLAGIDLDNLNKK